MKLLSPDEASQWFSPEREGIKPDTPKPDAPELPAPSQENLAEIAASVEDGGLANPGLETFGLETPDLESETAPIGTDLSVDDTLNYLRNGQSKIGVAFNVAASDLDASLNALPALKINLKRTPIETRSLAEQSGLSFYAVDQDPDFAQKKIEADRYRDLLGSFQRNIAQTPKLAAYLNEFDVLEQLAITSDVELNQAQESYKEQAKNMSLIERWANSIRQSFERGFKLDREVGNLALKMMQGTITEEERAELDKLRQAQAFYAQRDEGKGLWERMFQGAIGSVLVPGLGGIEGGVKSLAAYGPYALTAGAGIGSLYGSAAGGVGAIPGAIAGGLRALGATFTTGFTEDMMRQEGAQTFLALKDMDVPDDIARVLAIGAGAAKGGLEYLGLKSLGKLIPGAEKFFSADGVKAAVSWLEKNPQSQKILGGNLAAMLKSAFGEISTEIMQTGADIITEEVGRKISGVPLAGPSASEIGQRIWDTVTEQPRLLPR